MKQSVKNDLIYLGAKAGLFICLALFTFGFVFGLCRVNDNSMSPSCRNGDLILYYRLQKDYRAQDIIVIEKDGEQQLQRIIAKEGDTVDITQQGLQINGYLQLEKEIYTETLPYEEGIRFPVTLGQGEYFVLGDNRMQAKDSRIYGTVDQSEIKGGMMALLRRSGMQ